jgi:hypothetical protein
LLDKRQWAAVASKETPVPPVLQEKMVGMALPEMMASEVPQAEMLSRVRS